MAHLPELKGPGEKAGFPGCGGRGWDSPDLCPSNLSDEQDGLRASVCEAGSESHLDS